MKINIEDLIIQRSNKDELENILDLQKTAYQKEAERYNDFSIPPLLQTLEEITLEFCDSVFLTALYQSRIIGSVRAKVTGTSCEIGRLMVLPEFRRNGIGRMLVKAIESEIMQQFPSLVRFELFTGELSNDNIQLYESQGYLKFKTEPYDEEKNILYLEKYTDKYQ